MPKSISEVLAEHKAAAQAIVDKAVAEDRDMTDEELAAFDAAEAAYRSADERYKKGVEVHNRLSALSSDAGVDEDGPADEAAAKSLGEFFVKSAGDRLKQIKGVSGASVSAPEFKAAADTHLTGGLGGPLGPVLTEVDTSIVQTFRRPTVTSLFGQGTLAGQAITYFVEGAREGNFATVAEGGVKPQIHYADPTPVTEALSKIAGFIKLSDEMIEDLDFLVSEINGRLLYDLSLIEESQVLNGTGTAPNLRGLLNRVGIQTEAAANTAGAGDDTADALFRAMTKVAVETGLSADGIVINPVDYQALRLSKDGNGQYFGGGYFSGQYGQGGIVEQPPLWGLQTVVSPAVAAGTAIVGAFGQGATLYRKGGVRVEATNSNASDFISNLVTIRAEERIALAVRRPSAFVKVTLSA